MVKYLITTFLAFNFTSCGNSETKKPNKFRSTQRQSANAEQPSVESKITPPEELNKIAQPQSTTILPSTVKKEVKLTDGTGAGFYPVGTQVTINANDKTGYSFASWTGNIEVLSNKATKQLTFAMPDKDISFTPTYKISDPCNKSIKPLSIDEVEITNNCEGEVKNWPQTSTLTLNHGGGDSFSPRWAGQDTWPKPKFGDREVQGNLFVVYHKDCKWRAETFEWQPADRWPRDFKNIRDPKELALAPGTEIGIMITGLIRFCGFRNVSERTDIQWTILPGP